VARAQRIILIDGRRRRLNRVRRPQARSNLHVAAPP